MEELGGLSALGPSKMHVQNSWLNARGVFCFQFLNVLLNPPPQAATNRGPHMLQDSPPFGVVRSLWN